jgi:hypothetical protein
LVVYWVPRNMVLRIPSGPEGSSGSMIPCVLWVYPVSYLLINFY